MERKILEQEITDLQDILKEQTDILFSHDGIIPQIELDIVLENLRKLYTLINELNKPENRIVADSSHSVGSDTMDRITKKRHEIHQRHTVEPDEAKGDDQPEEAVRPVFNINTTTSLHPPVQEEPTPPQNTDEAIPEEKPESIKKPIFSEFTEPEVKEDSIDLFSSDSMTLADKLSNENNSVYDIIGKDANKELLADKLKQNKIDDLKSAIGINEKFLLVSELFGGNMHAYDESIKTLNQFNGFQEASVFLNHLKTKFSMDENSDSYKTLLFFVNRRYL